ncbi:Uma2 family endonuclease [Nonomuraea candida]|uniref:Uma2 family endonuclease n=1 Tax=Nonomuraea candida TaxID=359159 RepID=UPI000693326F|nr:Uma2 family endonuclease [Nonomuraea candida]
MATIEPSRTDPFLPSGRPFTIDDLLEFPDDGNRYELFNGSLLVSPAPTVLHQLAISNVMFALRSAAPPDLVALTAVNLRVSEKDYYIPDVVVVPRSALRIRQLMFAPQDMLLAVEVGSPSTKMLDEDLKAKAYEKAKVPVYWRIELDEGPVLYVHELNGDTYEPPVAHKAGTTVKLTKPFPVSIDPSQFVE